MKVVVTGGAGFIGTHVCRSLAAKQAVTDVVALDDLSTGSRENLHSVQARLIEGSINDPETLASAFENASAVVHLAARPSVPRSLTDPVASHEVNATGTVRVLEEARRSNVELVVVASSSSVYGANPVLPKSEQLASRPMSPYAASKLATEAYALAYQHSFQLPVLALRFFNVFGPLQPSGHAYAAVVPAFVSAAIEGRPLTVFGDGRQTRDFTYVETVADVIVTSVLETRAHPEPVNLAWGTRTDLLALITLLEEILETRVTVTHEPPRVGDVRDSQADSGLLRQLFANVEPVDLATGLRATVEWFRSGEW